MKACCLPRCALVSLDSKSSTVDGFVHSQDVIMFNCSRPGTPPSKVFEHQIKGFVSFWSL